MDQMAFNNMLKASGVENGPPADSEGNTAKNGNKKDNTNGLYGHSNAYRDADLQS